MDTAVSITFETLDAKIKTGLPTLQLACHESLRGSFGDTPDTRITGGRIDGSFHLQYLLGIDTDVDFMHKRCEPLSKDEQEEIIEYVPETGVYCLLNVTNHPKLQEKFQTRRLNGKLYLSAAEFRASNRYANELNLGMRKLIEKEEDVAGKASIVRTFHGAIPSDYVDYIPCRGCPKTGVPLLLVGKDIFKIDKFGLVPKCRPTGNPYLEWRLSFSVWENDLIRKTWSENDTIAFALLKCIVKKHVTVSFLTTYHLKMVMFMSQKFTYGYPRPKRGFQISQRLLGALDFLLHCLIQGCIPLIFVPTVNLLENVSEDILLTAARRLSAFRQYIKMLPDDLGLSIYHIGTEPGTRNVTNERIYLMGQYAFINISKDIENLKFDELQDLVGDPLVHLYMYESYLHKAMNDLGFSDDSMIKYAMISPLSLEYRYMLMRDILLLAFNAGALFGLSQWSHESEEELFNKRRKLLDLIGTNKIHYQTFDGDTFSAACKDFDRRSVNVNDLICLLPDTETYCSKVTEIIYERDIKVSSNLYEFMSSDLPYNLFNNLSIKQNKPESSIIFNLWATSSALFHIEDDLANGDFTQLGSLSGDPETVLYIFESFVNTSVQRAFPRNKHLVKQAMLSIEGKYNFARTLAMFFKESESKPRLFGFPERQGKTPILHLMKSMKSAKDNTISLRYDGIAFFLDIYEEKPQEFSKFPTRFVPLSVPGISIYFCLVTIIEWDQASRMHFKALLSSFHPKDKLLFFFCEKKMNMGLSCTQILKRLPYSQLEVRRRSRTKIEAILRDRRSGAIMEAIIHKLGNIK